VGFRSYIRLVSFRIAAQLRSGLGLVVPEMGSICSRVGQLFSTYEAFTGPPRAYILHYAFVKCQLSLLP
jgi:hypothetical protein